MKRIVSSLSAFALAFSLYGMPAMASASQTDANGSAAESTAVHEPSSPEAGAELPEGVMGPVQKDEDPAPTDTDQSKAPVYNEDADGAGSAASAGSTGSAGEGADTQAPDAADQEDLSLLDAIVGFFTGGADPADSASDATDERATEEDNGPVQINRSREATASSVEVTLHTSYPTALAALADAGNPLTLAVDGATAPFKATAAAGTVWTATVTNATPGQHTVTISGGYHLPLSLSVELKGGTKHAFSLTDDPARANDSLEPEWGRLPYGDFNGNRTLDDEDSRLMTEAYVQGASDSPLAFDLTADGSLTLSDIQAFVAVKGLQAQAPVQITETPDSSQTTPEVPEGTTVLVNGAVVTGEAAEQAIRQLTEGGGSVVALTDSANVVPGATKVPVSQGTPVTLSLNANGVLMDRITLYSPVEGGSGASMPLAGTVTIKFEMDGEDHELDIPLPCGNAHETSDASVLPYVIAEINQLAGTVHLDLGENVKVYDMDFTFTEAAGPDDTMVQLARIAYAATNVNPGPVDPIDPDPTPLPTIPEGLTIEKEDDRVIVATWEAAQNTVGYEVELITGMEDAEVLTTTQTRIQITSFAGQPLNNDTTYSVRVRAVSAEDAKSDWTAWANATPHLKTPPANPSGLVLTPGYQEITATWDPVDRADDYTLCYAKQGSTDFARIDTTATTCTVRYLDDNASYTFYIVANNVYGSSDATGTPPRVTGKTTYVTTKVPWYGLINRTVQDPEAYLSSDVIKSVTAGGSEEEGAKLVDGNYNTVYTLPDGLCPEWKHAAKVTFHETHDIRELALSTSLGTGFADDIEDVWVRTVSGRGVTTTTFTKANGLTVEDKVPQRDGAAEAANNTIMITLPQVVANASQVEVIITRARDASITISELAFYKANTFQESIDALFEYGSLNTQLKEGVTEETISSLRQLLNTPDEATNMAPNTTPELYWHVQDYLDQLDVAEALLEGEEARTITTHPELFSGEASTASVRGANAWQPTGAVAAAGAKVQVHVTPATGWSEPQVEAGSGTQLRLIYVQHFGTETEFQSFGNLALGVNSFTIPQLGYGNERGGSLYVEYESANCPAYEVKVTGARQVPVLDVFGMTDNTQIKQACMAYASELEAYAQTAKLRDLHTEDGHKGGFAEQLCIANATEVLTTRALISVPATLMTASFAQAKADQNVDGAAALSTGLPFTDKMIALMYQQAGLFNTADPANASTVAQFGTANALPSTHLNFRYQQTASGMQVMANCLGLGWDQAIGVGTAPTLLTKASGKYSRGESYGWELSQLVAKAVAADNCTFPQVLSDYYAQLVTAKDRNSGMRFSYDDVSAYLASPTGGTLDTLPNNLGIAVLWQLHLAYDAGYSYTLFSSAEEQMDSALFARMNAFVRNPGSAPAGLDLEGADADNTLMRLACAASGKNLMGFFDAWGLAANADTRAFAATLPAETRSLQYINDESRVSSLFSAMAALASEVQVADTLQVTGPNEEGEVTVAGIGLADGVRASSNLGFEVLRQVGADADTREVVGFVPAGQDSFVDRLTSDNGQTLTYYVRAVDVALTCSDAAYAGEAQAAFSRNLNKAYWTVTSTMASEDDPATVVDGSTATVYRGQRVGEAVGIMGGATTDANAYASVTIAFGKPTDVCGIRYFPGTDVTSTFKRLWVQVSNDGANWTSVGYKEIDEAAFAISRCAMVYFTKAMVMPSAAASEGEQISVQNARFLRVSDLDTSADTPISIAEIDVIGSLPDAVSFADAVDGDVPGIGVVDAEMRVSAAADGTFEGAETVIPAGSLVFSGRYTGNPAKSTLVVRDGSGEDISQDATQVIMAERDLGNSITHSASGTWIVFFEPGTWEDDVEAWDSVSAALYRATTAGDLEGAALTASCSSVSIPRDASGDVVRVTLDLGTGM